ncbi:MAG TPA: thiamine phosphate synthase [Bryobacteraceae bacterium]|jgi:thiamine-phosphate pyrophosphorylase|nr:thiamine phosphate synthase [Bryobacteraceae bacterium]
MRLKLFYPILDTETAARRGIDPVDAAARILEAGAGLLQLRHKGFFSREVFHQAREISELCRSADAQFVINDRADIAKLLGAALHLGQDDLPPADARRVLGDSATLGFSSHNEAQLRAAAGEPVDYLALGPIFETPTKLNPDPVVGVEELRRLRPFTARPLVAIGGITRANARSVIDAGADSVAVIGDLLPEDGNIRERVEEWISLVTEAKANLAAGVK